MRLLSKHREPVRCLAYSPDGRRLASGGDGNVVLVWSLDDTAAGPELRLEGHADWVRAVAFSPDRRRIASASWDDTVRFWSIARKSQTSRLSGFAGGAWSLAYSADGALAVGSGDGTVRVVRSAEDRNPLMIRAHRMPVSAVAFTPDGKSLLTASHDRGVALWSASWGERLAALAGHADWARAADVSPASGLLASAGDDGKIIVWHAEKHHALATLEGHAGPISRVAFCPDGRGLVSVGWDGTARLWDARAGRQSSAYDWGAGRLLSLAVAPDGMTAAAGAEDGRIFLWDLDPADG